VAAFISVSPTPRFPPLCRPRRRTRGSAATPPRCLLQRGARYTPSGTRTCALSRRIYGGIRTSFAPSRSFGDGKCEEGEGGEKKASRELGNCSRNKRRVAARSKRPPGRSRKVNPAQQDWGGSGSGRVAAGISCSVGENLVTSYTYLRNWPRIVAMRYAG